jgi:PadR family transcriptional regulator PadR
VDTSQLLKGVLERADGYGYQVVRGLRAAGLQEVGDASVYGTLGRLYNAGLLTSYVVPSEEGPHRRYYSVNVPGRDRLRELAKTWGHSQRRWKGWWEPHDRRRTRSRGGGVMIADVLGPAEAAS